MKADSDKILTKALFIIICITCFVFLYVGVALSQENLLVKEKSIMEIKAEQQEAVLDFSAREHEGRLYFNVTVCKDNDEGLYILERSLDNEKFEAVEARRNHPTDVEIPVIYSFKEEDIPVFTAQYRLMKYTLDGAEVVGEYTHQGFDKMDVFAGDNISAGEDDEIISEVIED